MVREAVVASLAGVSALSDVIAVAFRAPNALQNLLGDQALSASFITTYSRLLAADRRRDAGALAGAIFGLLFAVVAGVSLLGVVLAPWLVRVLAPGFAGDAQLVAAGAAVTDRLDLTVRAVRITFPMVSLITLSAWCLGVLNSHRRFLLPYVAPCFWNASVIAALWFVGAQVAGAEADRVEELALAACWGGLLGGLLQFGVQLPTVLRVTEGLRPSFRLQAPGVRRTLRALGPAVAGRGVVQLGAYLDVWLASFLTVGAATAIGLGQRLYLLPISLFGVSVAAAELPELSRIEGDRVERSESAARRTESSLALMSFLVAPTFVGYVALGFGIVGVVYRRGAFDLADNWLVFLVLVAYSFGLLASSASRLLQSVFFSLGDTRNPAVVAAIRLAVSFGLGAALIIWFDRVSVAEVVPAGWLDPADRAAAAALGLGAVGLALGSMVGSWLEIALLIGGLRRHGVLLEPPWPRWRRHLGLAAACIVPWASFQLLEGPLVVSGVLPVVGFAVTYLVAARLLRFREALFFWSWAIGETRRSGSS